MLDSRFVIWSLILWSKSRVFCNTEAVLFSEGLTLAQVEFDGTNNRTTIAKCQLYDLDVESESLKISEAVGLPLKNISFYYMMTLIKNCSTFAETVTTTPSTLPADEDIYNTESNMTDSTIQVSKWSLLTGIYPGTKWCGMGDIATKYVELGERTKLDKCCRAHDHCPIKLKAFRRNYQLFNFSLYTKSHCDCDEDFYNCLKGTVSRPSDVIGNLFFNVLKIPCLKHKVSLVCEEKVIEENGEEVCLRWKKIFDRNQMVFSERFKKY